MLVKIAVDEVYCLLKLAIIFLLKMDDKLLERVLESKTFAQKEAQKGLLKFLFDASLQKKHLKEADIAIGFFNRAQFVPGDDTIVRVSVHKLRTQLEKYYADEGKKDKFILEIPRGSYLIAIKEKPRKLGAKKPLRNPVVWALAIIAAGSVLVNLYLFSTSQKARHYNNVIWGDYLKAQSPVFITLFNPFFFHVKQAGGKDWMVRDLEINSKDELAKAQQIHLQESKNDISELNYPYFSRNNLWPLPNLIGFFAKADKEVRLQTLSESNIDDIKNNDVIFIANINSFGWMDKFLSKSHISISAHPRSISYIQDERKKTLQVPEVVKGNYVDYAFIVKTAGPNNNLITLMGDFHATGLRGLTSFINNSKVWKVKSSEITKRYGAFPTYFEMLVKVTSYNYSDFDTELIYFKPL